MNRIYPKFLLTLLFGITGSMASAYDCVINGIYYNRSSTTTLTVTYKSESNYDAYSGNVVIPEEVTYMGKTFRVTSIGKRAFYNCCTKISSITIPKSITYIGDGAFFHYPSSTISFSRVNITDLEAWCNILFSGSASNPLSIAHKLYLNGNEVKELNIPSSIKELNSKAFYGCHSITAVKFPENFQEIGSAAFYGCLNLKSVSLPDGITKIDFGAFQDCTSLSSIALPGSLEKIEEATFAGCSSLSSISFSEGLVNIENLAFYECKRLTSIEFPNSLKTIGDDAFAYCI